MGKAWYKAGIQLQKMNTFQDFISCCDYLITNKFSKPGLMAAAGTSAGGLLIGTSEIVSLSLVRCCNEYET